jgi:hypothetical protein
VRNIGSKNAQRILKERGETTKNVITSKEINKKLINL